MKATELFVEQVLIGSMVLVALALMVLPQVDDLSSRLPELAGDGLFGAIGFIGLAYLIGIPSDRLIDTILAGPEKRMRLWFAFDRKPARSGDPFPEGKWRRNILVNGGGSLSHLNYLRSRMRLSRAMAVMGPAITIAGMMAMTHAEVCAPPSGWLRWVDPFVVLMTGTAYLAAFIGGMNSDLPRTNDKLRFEEFVRTNEWSDYKSKKRKPPIWRSEPVLLWASVGLAVCGASLYVGSGLHPGVLGIGVAGSILSIASAWSWARITETFQVFLTDCNESAGSASP